MLVNGLVRGLFTMALLVGSSTTVTAQSIFEAIVATSFDVAGHVEHHRSLPESIDVQGAPLAPSAWMQLGVLTLLNLSGVDTEQVPRSTWQMPALLHPRMRLDEAAYGRVLDRQDYLAFLQALAATYPDGATLPATFPLNGGDFRFVDAFHLVAGVLRFYAAYGYLPPFVDPKVATPRGLFEWDIPEGKETWLSAFQNQNGEPYLNTNEYYKNAALDYELYQLAYSLVGEDFDPYVAGEHLFAWSFDRYNQSPYGLNFDVDNLMGFVDDAWEMIGNMQGTSGKPSGINRGLYVAAGLVHGYDRRGYGGALFTEEHGWYNAEIHTSYGAALSANRLFSFDGDPAAQGPYAVPLTAEATLFTAVNALAQRDTRPPALRAFWVNPSDVTIWGGEALVQAAREGGFNTIVLTVKSFVGRLYFETGSNTNRGGDALRPLLAAAANHPEIEVYAAFNTLGDYEMHRAATWGQRYFHGTGYNEFFMSPCIPAYVGYLKQLIRALYQRYAVDGLVLARNYVHSNAWANPECGLGSSASDRVKEERIANFANDLAGHAKSLDADRKVFYMTAPLLDAMGTALETYSHDAAPEKLSRTHFDGIILTLHGLAWLTPDNEGFPLPSQAARDQYLATYKQATTLPLHAMVHLSKDWMYSPAFYRGLARFYRSNGVLGVFLTGINSAEGEFGPAFVKQHVAKVRHIRFDDPPPTPDVVTHTEPVGPVPPRLAVQPPYPNPVTGSVRLAFEQPTAGLVVIRVYDMLGRIVTTLDHRFFPQGRHAVSWRADSVPGGVYFIRIDAPSGSASHRVVVL